MRIAYIVPSLGLVEGQGRANLELLRRVARAGHHVDVFTGSAPDVVTSLRNVRVRRVPRLPAWQFGNQLLMLGATAATVRRGRYDLVHADAATYGSTPDVVVVHTVSARWFDLPDDVWREPGLRGRHADAVARFKAWLEIKQARTARAVVANSTATADDLVARGVSRDRITVLPFGVDSERLHPADERERAEARRSLGIPPDDFVVLFVGAHGPRKGLPAVLEALDGAPRGTRLLVAGEHRGGRWAREAQRRGIACSMPGKLADIRPAYWAADVLVYPSRYDAFGMAVLEAMACGLPVVVSRAAGSHEIVGDAGIVLDEAGPAGIRAAIERLRSDEVGRRAMAVRARAIAVGRDWDEAGRILLQIYGGTTKK